MPQQTRVNIRQVPAADVYPLRHKVLRPNRPFADCIWAQDDDPDTVHFAAMHNGQIIGIASIAICPRQGDPPNTWRLRGMATEPDWRGQRIGAQVLQAALAYAQEKGGAIMWCNARTSALEFYRRYGFRTVGDEFETPGVGPHYVMERPL